jgi:cobalt/nickel transport protein
MDKRHIVMLLLVAIILTIPFFLYPGKGEVKGFFSGSDDQGSTAIEKTGYHPWFHFLWVPPSPETESFLFTLQAAIGSIIIGYILGYWSGKASTKQKNE